jgi:hypothetical protein
MERKERVQVIEDDGYLRRQRVVEYAPEARQIIVARVIRLMWLVSGIATVLIAFRFVLNLIAANPNSGFAAFIYGVTQFLVAPFSSIVRNPMFDTGGVLDIASLFAIVVYLVLTWIVVTLFRILFAGTRSSRHVTTVEREKGA